LAATSLVRPDIGGPLFQPGRQVDDAHLSTQDPIDLVDQVLGVPSAYLGFRPLRWRRGEPSPS
jgi:hypothetical protein